jgi:hypothetical protein
MNVAPTHARSVLRTCLLLLAFVTAPACTSIGPPMLKRDRFDYSNALSNSAREQMLLNLVRLRYMESPVFLDVTSVVNQYTLEGTLRAGIDSGPIFNSQAGGAEGTYADRPTVTYAPRRGEDFTRSLLRPIPPSSLFALAQAGWNIDFLFLNSTNAINGVYNRFGSGLRARPADPGFAKLMSLLRDIQKASSTGIRIDEKGEQAAAVFFFTRNAAPEIERKIREVNQLLGLDPDTREFNLTYGAVAENDNEVTVLSRSLLEMMANYSSDIEVPQKHVEEQRTWGTLEPDDGLAPLMKIRSGPKRDRNAAISAKYRDHWFWIDDRDFQSKRAFLYLMIISSLTETGEATAPILTIPAG